MDERGEKMFSTITRLLDTLGTTERPVLAD